MRRCSPLPSFLRHAREWRTRFGPASASPWRTSRRVRSFGLCFSRSPCSRSRPSVRPRGRPLTRSRATCGSLPSSTTWQRSASASLSRSGPGIAVRMVDHRIYGFLLVPLSLAAAALFSIVTNNIADRSIDCVAHPSRPTVTGAVEGQLCAHRLVGTGLLARGRGPCEPPRAALHGPHRRAVLPVFPRTVPTGAQSRSSPSSLSARAHSPRQWSGLLFYGGNPLHFPLPFALLFLVAVSLVANVLDLDDRDADKAAGMRTLPVMVGDRVSRILVAVACVASFGWVYAILGRSTLLAPMVVLAALSAGLILWRRIRRSILIWSAVAGLTLLATAVLLPW